MSYIISFNQKQQRRYLRAFDKYNIENSQPTSEINNALKITTLSYASNIFRKINREQFANISNLKIEYIK